MASISALRLTPGQDDAGYFARYLTHIGYLPADFDPQKFVDDLYVDIFALEAAKK
jgi:NitT/TauT family transport system substrate-binding protein